MELISIITILIIFVGFSLYHFVKSHKKYEIVYLIYFNKFNISRAHVVKKALQIITQISNNQKDNNALLMLVCENNAINAVLYKMFKRHIMCVVSEQDISTLKKYNYKKLVLLCNSDSQVQEVAKVFEGKQFLYTTIIDKIIRTLKILDH